MLKYRTAVANATCAALLGLGLSAAASAALVVADFNDLTPGQLVGQSGGTGLSNAWASSANPQVIPGDLTAPAATNYGIVQTGAPQSIRTTANSTNSNGQSTRTTAETLAGTVWFSFLVNQVDSNSRSGMSFNAGTAAAGGARMTAVGQNFFVSYGTGPTLNNLLTIGQTTLVVGQVVVDENGANDRLRIWLNPDISTLTPDTTTGRVFDMNNADWVGAGVTSIAVASYGSNSPGGIVDAVRVSNDADAFAQVTGVPEPTGLAALALGAAALVSRRRRRRA